MLIRDDDQPGVRLGVRSLNALEGQPASYGTRLLSQPNANVTLNVSTGTVSAASVGNTQLTFTPADWDVEQTVTLDLGDDDVANGSRTLTVRHSLSSSDSRFNGLVDESMTVNIVDDDSPGIFLLASAVSVGEDGSSDSYELRLTSRPSAPVTVAVSGDGQAEPDRSSLTFTAQNWDQAQTVNVTAVDDRVAEENGDGLLQHGVSSDDPGYDGLAAGTMLVRIADNDVAGLAVGAPEQAVVVEGQRTTYAVALRSQPTGSVSVRVATDGRISASPSTLTFDAGNWNQAQTVTLTATDDRVDVRPDRQAAVVSHTAFSADAMYHELSVEGLTLAVQDDDVAALQLSTARLDLGAGQSGSYSVQLATEPTGEVLVELTAGEGLAVAQTGCTVEESGTPCLTFTPQNWDVAQNVTVTAETEAAGQHRPWRSQQRCGLRRVEQSLVRQPRRQPAEHPGRALPAVDQQVASRQRNRSGNAMDATAARAGCRGVPVNCGNEMGLGATIPDRLCSQSGAARPSVEVQKKNIRLPFQVTPTVC